MTDSTVAYWLIASHYLADRVGENPRLSPSPISFMEEMSLDVTALAFRVNS